MKAFSTSTLAACGFFIFCQVGNAQLALTGSIALAEEGGTLAAGNLSTLPGSTAFAKDVLGGGGFGSHQTVHLNDGIFGNSNSWIGDTTPTFGGVAFSAPQTVQSFAFGRDNTGGFFDRDEGLYTLQWTQVAGPGAGTADTGNAATGWATIGTLNYGPSPQVGSNYTAPHLRHRYNFNAVMGATGMRLIVPLGGLAGGTAIDELEFYSTAGAVTPPPSPVVTTANAGFSLSWDGNDGDFRGGSVPANLAPAGTAISSSDLQPTGTHQKIRVNDGIYGNANSWIGGDPTPFIGVDLGALHNVTSFAFGRSNVLAGDPCPGGVCKDRSLGLYTIEYTVNGTDWLQLGTTDYKFRVDDVTGGGFTEYLRHEFDIGLAGGGPVQMQGLRLFTPSGAAVDELEIYGTLVPEPSGVALLGLGLFGLFLRRRR